jgi:hypothetical protein
MHNIILSEEKNRPITAAHTFGSMANSPNAANPDPIKQAVLSLVIKFPPPAPLIRHDPHCLTQCSNPNPRQRWRAAEEELKALLTDIHAYSIRGATSASPKFALQAVKTHMCIALSDEGYQSRDFAK